MNKGLIKTYKAEFDHWLNGGTLLYRYFNYTKQNFTAWEECNAEFSWNIVYLNAISIIINDEFVEFRKALAEGKTVQYNFGNHGINKKDFPNKWKDLDISIGILADRASPKNYKIKPEEPKFKVGDWVVEIHSTTKAQVLELFGNQIRVKFCYPDAIITTDSSDFIPWAPKKGDWCWFWDEGFKTPLLLQFKKLSPSSFYPYETLNGLDYMYCEPFLGKLPTKLQK